MRALVTGADGFVGRHLVEALHAEGADVVACSADLGDLDALRAAVDLARPDTVFHLAGRAFVPDSISAPLTTYDINAIGTARLTSAIRGFVADGGAMPRLLFPSSAEVYGPREAGDFPLSETLATAPGNPYAASKAAAEAILLGEARSFGLDVVIARAFNHIGPGQSDRFVVASFAMQMARVAAGKTSTLLVGNLDAKRDFLDVRDVVNAYVALARSGVRGEIYNVCSGVARPIRDALRELILAAHVPVEVREDSERMRPSDVPLLVGDNRRLVEATGWQPKIPFTRSIRDIYQAALTRVEVESAATSN